MILILFNLMKKTISLTIFGFHDCVCNVRPHHPSLFLSLAIDSGDLQAAWALDIHEEAVGRLDHALQLVLGLLLRGAVQKYRNRA